MLRSLCSTLAAVMLAMPATTLAQEAPPVVPNAAPTQDAPAKEGPPVSRRSQLVPIDPAAPRTPVQEKDTPSRRRELIPLTASAPSTPAKLPSLDLLRDDEVEKTFAAIPVQESGRIKPLQKVAETRLKAFRGRVSIWLTQDGEMDGKPINDPATGKPIAKENGKPMKLSAVEWLLVSWFRPDIAKTIPLFTVDNSSAIAELGLQVRAKRDQYTFQDIEPARNTLMEKMNEYRQIPSRQQSPEQRMIVQLAASFLDDEMIMGHFDFVRAPVGDKENLLPATIEKPVRLSKSMGALIDAMKGGGPPMQIPWFRDFGKAALGAMMSGNPESQWRLFPPADKTQEVWYGPGSMLFESVNRGTPPSAEELSWLAQYEEMYLSLPDAGKFKAAAKALQTKITEAAAARGETRFINLELHAIRADYFFYAQWLFLVGYLGVALTWVLPGSKLDLLGKGWAWLFLSAATALAITGIVIRCIIMQRPPIATLYETIIFIGAACGLFGLITEALTRRGLGFAIAAVMGTGCMFLAIQFDASETTDSLQQLQAVLITEFWLATHVPMINLGYAACMVAAIVSQFYFIYRLTGYVSPMIRRWQKILPDGKVTDIRRLMSKVCYGFVCAGLFLALVGTVLGGIWANYSWGRFWGWDPKENGALMIVLMCLVILHARLGGYIREVGLHCCGLILGCIVIFSWFGVNQLGVGLHAYGFTEGTWPKIYTYWGSQALLLVYGLCLAIKDRSAKAEPAGLPSQA